MFKINFLRKSLILHSIVSHSVFTTAKDLCLHSTAIAMETQRSLHVTFGCAKVQTKLSFGISSRTSRSLNTRSYCFFVLILLCRLI